MPLHPGQPPNGAELRNRCLTVTRRRTAATQRPGSSGQLRRLARPQRPRMTRFRRSCQAQTLVSVATPSLPSSSTGASPAGRADPWIHAMTSRPRAQPRRTSRPLPDAGSNVEQFVRKDRDWPPPENRAVAPPPRKAHRPTPCDSTCSLAAPRPRAKKQGRRSAPLMHAAALVALHNTCTNRFI